MELNYSKMISLNGTNYHKRRWKNEGSNSGLILV